MGIEQNAEVSDVFMTFGKLVIGTPEEVVGYKMCGIGKKGSA